MVGHPPSTPPISLPLPSRQWRDDRKEKVTTGTLHQASWACNSKPVSALDQEMALFSFRLLEG